MKKLLPILLAIIGIGSGVGAGIMLKPSHEPVVAENPCESPEFPDEVHEAVATEPEEAPQGVEYAEMSNQFIVPVVLNDKVTSMVVMTLSIEVPEGMSEEIYAREPKLRDKFLQIMFDYANMGGFKGNFTAASTLEPLRAMLITQAKRLLPGVASDVLILDIIRQDI
ncbi:hypothetical protein SAMN05421688_2593 [Poseidonocella pacifica]|uniref:Flagellar protein FliL n=1 Tax=Poseidonocella pacifica TaxID=871651 RepID=A0A1I0XWD8_9RHOB|nr:flagellar basal body-associated FliL family protein [Poseidonocella pacifica]SFB05385.1 hypothetical protein SAMN05421688_2593 [Poseidonocella pacifica]